MGKGEGTYPRGGGEPQQEKQQPEALPAVGLCRWPGLFPPCGLPGAGPHRPLLALEPCLLSVRASTVALEASQHTHTHTHTHTHARAHAHSADMLLHLCTDFNTACIQYFEALLAMLKKGRGGLLRMCSESKQHFASAEPATSGPADMHDFLHDMQGYNVGYQPMHVCQKAEC